MDKEIKLELITPEKAQVFLNANPGTRKLIDGLVEKYAADMAAENWTDCPAPIVIYFDGTIADGQHRLWAILESGKAQHFYVVRHFDRKAGLNLDNGRGRTLVDNARISGEDPSLSNALVALALFYDVGNVNRQTLSNRERLTVIAKHREPCVWALTHGPSGKGYRNASILAAIARAKAAGAEADRLQRFSKVLSSGLSEGPADFAAVTLRNYIQAKGNRILAHERRDIFMKAMNAIHYFMRLKPLNVIKAIKDEVYPLAGTPLLARTASPKATVVTSATLKAKTVRHAKNGKVIGPRQRKKVDPTPDLFKPRKRGVRVAA